jgi:hypothetical protein
MSERRALLAKSRTLVAEEDQSGDPEASPTLIKMSLRRKITRIWNQIR